MASDYELDFDLLQKLNCFVVQPRADGILKNLSSSYALKETQKAYVKVCSNYKYTNVVFYVIENMQCVKLMSIIQKKKSKSSS